jgi:hypothetical protein
MSAATNRPAHAGATAFFELLRDLRRVPGVRVMGKRPSEDGSATYGYDVGQDLIGAALKTAGFSATDTERAAGFAASMSWYLVPELDGVSTSLGDDPAEDAARALLDVATAKAGTPLGAHAEAPAAVSPSAEEHSRFLTVERFNLINGALGEITDIAEELGGKDAQAAPKLARIRDLTGGLMACADCCDATGDDTLARLKLDGAADSPQVSEPSIADHAAAHLKRDTVAGLFEEIATLANRLDRECFFAHGDLVEDREPEQVQLELDRLRDAVCRIGWMADLGHEHLMGGPEVRGDAEAWLLSPRYRDMRDAAALAARRPA